MSQLDMFVTKRSGEKEGVSFDKIQTRLRILANLEYDTLPKLKNINITEITMKVIQQMYDSISTCEIDELSAQQCASLITLHNDYGELAKRIVVSNHQKNTDQYTFKKVMEMLYKNKDIHQKHSPIITKEIYEIACDNEDFIEKEIDYTRDFYIDYFGFKTLERAYLMKVTNVIVERPQHLWMRVAFGIHGLDIGKALETYHLLSKKYFIHATPTLFNAGTPRPQLSSCYLISMQEDSILGIYETLKDCALISKWAGGIGLHIHNVRATGTQIRGTNGTSNGIVPMLRVFNNTARYVDQGGGKRNGSFAIYLEPWHADIEDFIEMKKNHGDEEIKARDLFYALWIPDLFMKRVKSGGQWTLMCPDKCPGLSDCYGEEFEKLYVQYENEGRGNKTIPARKLWLSIIDSQIETGTPYMLYKDSCNEKSNHNHLGTIKSSNLCTEIIEYSDKDETAVCNLASIGLPSYVKPLDLKGQKAIVYTKTNCPYCKLAKNFLLEMGATIEEITLDDDTKRKELYSTLSDKENKEINSVPQIYVDDVYIGGYDLLIDTYRPNFDFAELEKVVRIVTNNLNKIIDVNYYPTKKTYNSNIRHRPIGIGVQGLADVFSRMYLAFDDERAKLLNKQIFETIYHGALEESILISQKRGYEIEPLLKKYNPNPSNKTWHFDSNNNIVVGNVLSIQNYIGSKSEFINYIERFNIAKEECDAYYDNKRWPGAYSSFVGSALSKGKLQFDFWNIDTTEQLYKDWDEIREKIQLYGCRNSLLVAPMPTASTSQILGNNECFEPFTSNIYSRRTIAGEFVMVNHYLMHDLTVLGLWNEEMKNEIIYHKGSIGQIERIPKCIRERYKTVWDMSMKNIIDMSRDRGAYICQSQSLNLFVEDPTYEKMTKMHFYAWEQKLKTGMYYLRTRPKWSAQQFTIDPSLENKFARDSINTQENDICESCSG
jgi:ribonucleoside-diphosphate reductase alpha subunit